uniref:Uncharacterized protein n=1 Tax=Siphoviridae sp. ct3o911 TaxID=2827560 RepID=A0A8S5LJQ2_9CAUD|nr:MAG TPA: hypothetical protein [Siphoviridae sp. ct3o911]
MIMRLYIFCASSSLACFSNIAVTTYLFMLIPAFSAHIRILSLLTMSFFCSLIVMVSVALSLYFLFDANFFILVFGMTHL